MKLPQTQNPERYIGLYVLDFGDHCAVGYTAAEVATLLESEQFSHVKAYKIHHARPNGQLELAGVARSRFEMESGLFFHCRTEDIGEKDFDRLADWAAHHQPPCRCKLHLGRRHGNTLLIALVYPAEYEQEIGQWLGDSGFVGSGPVDAGISQVSRYYQNQPEIIRQEQFWPAESLQNRDRQTLLKAVGQSFQR